MKANAKEWDSVWSSKKMFYKFLNFLRNIFSKDLYRKVFRKYINKNTNLLEVGCGSSTTSLYLAGKIKKFTGLDISNEALRISRKKAENLGIKNVEFVKGSCFKMPFKNNSFDVVWSQGLLEHFDNPEDIISEKIRVCKQKGYIITSVPGYWSIHKIWYVLTRPKLLRKLWPWTEQTFFTGKQLNSMANDRVKIIKTFHYMKYGVVIQILQKK